MGDTTAGSGNQYLTFVMGSEDYAISVTGVSEVLTVPKVTRLPRMPDFMRGVVNLRGSVVPILDLKRKFGGEETLITPETAIVVVEIPLERDSGAAGVLRLGIFADSVKKVVTIASSEIEPPPRIGSRIKTSFIQGMGRIGEEFIVILNMREILTDEDLARVESARQAEPEA
jgi:purine-binding chemotaxis protein CheW